MKFANLIIDGKTTPAIATENGYIDLSGVENIANFEDIFTLSSTTLNELSTFATLASASSFITNEQIQYAPAIARNAKIFCVGVNYLKHAQEMGREPPTTPVIFSKFQNAVAAHNQKIELDDLQTVDYEAELGVIIGKRGKKIAEENALEHVFGYCIANDVTDRSKQKRTSQWLLGKSIDSFLPIGPFVVSKEAIKDPQNLTIQGKLNGELRQDSNTADMIFSIAHCIHHISQNITLEPGDLIITGTPEGVISGRKNKLWLKDGDTYEIEIEGLGKLTNQFVRS